MQLLLVEDDHDLSKNIAEAFQAEGFLVTPVYDGLLASKLLGKETYDCIVLDVNLPGKTGFDICRDFRQFNTTTPVLMLTAFGELDDKVRGFDYGADDYLTKPFFMRELLMRVHALIKRSKTIQNGTTTQTLIAGDIRLDMGQKRVYRQSKEVVLTPREFQLLAKLMEKNGELVSKSELIREIWGNSMDGNTNTIEVYVNFLRNKLDKPFGKASIKTKVGYGYYLQAE